MPRPQAIGLRLDLFQNGMTRILSFDPGRHMISARYRSTGIISKRAGGVCSSHQFMPCRESYDVHPLGSMFDKDRRDRSKLTTGFREVYIPMEQRRYTAWAYVPILAFPFAEECMPVISIDCAISLAWQMAMEKAQSTFLSRSVAPIFLDIHKTLSSKARGWQ
ncbi:uncharacterized protein K489DRAFT_135751 [Dissoconium aciculare CBS 342.82]|uniref:Uncharacterized protein n=1 Tax=Dissoconium aciculare CBS 342.82 TaxID=1314786 RepID=A0A6J3LTX3_9PEZI|nr:uncharacterized protein K489DRAFT_135751 [Dissoconium aciculare CBS 342.82]KAF1818072.1 hypothetical protein K489DRAFT_135751 [Dissoconium aciculare CBS 342.82]